MKIKETLKGIGESIGGLVIWILIIAAIFGIISVIKRPSAITPLSALEALPEAKKIAKEKYPDAQLRNVEANTGEIESQVSGSYGTSDTIEVKTKWNENPKPLHDDGTAEEWYFSFYSPSKKLDVIVNIVKRKSSGDIEGDISTKEVKLSFSQRAGLSKEEIEKKNKELQEGRESAIFEPKNWKIDSTKAAKIARSKVSGEFSISRLVLGGQKDGTLTWVASSAELKKSTGERQGVWKTIAKVNAVSGEIVGASTK